MGYIYLAVAIVAEVIGTTALKSSDQFSKLLPSLIVVCAYAISFYCLSVVLKTIPVGVAYAIWSGLGIVLIALAGLLLFNQKLQSQEIIGMVLVVAGVVVMNATSSSPVH